MADPVKVVKAALAAAAPVTALVGDRISPNPRKQGEVMPAIVLTVVSTVPTTHLRGDGSLDECRVQVDCIAATYAAAVALADAARAALQSAERVLVSESTDFEEFTEASVVSQDYLLWIHPTA